MTLDELLTWARIVEAGNLTAAARATRQSLASVSRQLQSLEAELGVTLARRSTRRFAVTDEGRDLYDRALRILREVDGARGISRSEGVRGSLTVSVGVTLGRALVVPRVGALLRAHPGLRLDLRLEDRVADLISDGVDVAVRAGIDPPDSAHVVAAPVWRFSRVVVAAPSYLALRGGLEGPDALARHACLVQRGASGAICRWRLVRGNDDQDVEVSGPLASTTPLVLHEAALDGAGLAFLPVWLVADDLARGRLVDALPGWTSRRITTWAVYRRERRTAPAVRAFVAAITTPDGAR